MTNDYFKFFGNRIKTSEVEIIQQKTTLLYRCWIGIAYLIGMILILFAFFTKAKYEIDTKLYIVIWILILVVLTYIITKLGNNFQSKILLRTTSGKSLSSHRMSPWTASKLCRFLTDSLKSPLIQETIEIPNVIPNIKISELVSVDVKELPMRAEGIMLGLVGLLIGILTLFSVLEYLFTLKLGIETFLSHMKYVGISVIFMAPAFFLTTKNIVSVLKYNGERATVFNSPWYDYHVSYEKLDVILKRIKNTLEKSD